MWKIIRPKRNLDSFSNIAWLSSSIKLQSSSQNPLVLSSSVPNSSVPNSSVPNSPVQNPPAQTLPVQNLPEQKPSKNTPWISPNERGLFPLLAPLSPLILKIHQANSNTSNRVSVTDASSIYCEVKKLYDLSNVAPPEAPTQAMIHGKKIHQKIETLIHESLTIERPSDCTTFENWFIDLWLMLQKLQMLMPKPEKKELGLNERSIAREIPVFGIHSYKNTRIFGIMDQIFWFKDQLYICDMKTTTSNILPSESTTASHHNQVLLYHYLFNQMCQNPDIIRTYLSQDLDLYKPITKRVSELLKTDLSTISQLIDILSQKLPPISDIAPFVLLEYIARDNKKYKYKDKIYPHSVFLHDCSYKVLKICVDYDRIKFILTHNLPFWHGDRPAQGVAFDQRSHICRNCQFKYVCSWYNS